MPIPFTRKRTPVATSISQLLQNSWNRILAFLGRRRTLDSFSRDELLAERVRMEQGEARILREIERIERERAALFEAAQGEPSQTVCLVQARKIRDLDHRATTLAHSLDRLSKQLRVADQLLAGEELHRLQRGNADIAGAIEATGSLELQAWVEGEAALQAVAEGKLDQVIVALGEARTAQMDGPSEDAEVAAILAQIEQAAASEALVDAIADDMALPQGGRVAARQMTENAVLA